MSILDTFFVLFEADASKLDKGLADADKKSEGLLDKLKHVDAQASTTGASFMSLIEKSAGLLGVGLSFGAIISGIRSTAASYKQLELLAARFRSTAEAVDNFRDSAALIGITEEQSVGALKGLETAVQDTFLGLGRAKKVFEELGVEVTDAHGKIKSTTAIMGELQGKLAKLDKGTQIRVMERLGLDPALLKLFTADMVELQRRMDEVDRASGFDLSAAVKRASEFTKANKALSLEVNTLRMFLTKLSEGLKIAALPYFTKAIEIATKYVGMFVAFLMKHADFVKGFFIAVGAAITYFLIPAAVKGAIAVWAMIAPFALMALAAVAVATAFALLYDDVMNFLDGNDSLIGQILQKWPRVGEVAKGIGAAFAFVFDIARALLGFLVGMWKSPTDAFQYFQDDLMTGLNRLFEAFPGLQAGFDSVMHGVQVAGEVIVNVWDAIVAAVRLAVGVLTAGIQAVIGAVNKVRSVLGFPAAPAPAPAAPAPPADTQAAPRSRPPGGLRLVAAAPVAPVPGAEPAGTRVGPRIPVAGTSAAASAVPALPGPPGRPGAPAVAAPALPGPAARPGTPAPSPAAPVVNVAPVAPAPPSVNVTTPAQVPPAVNVAPPGRQVPPVVNVQPAPVRIMAAREPTPASTPEPLPSRAQAERAPDTRGTLAMGQQMLQEAAASPLTAQTSSSITNNSRTRGDTKVEIKEIKVETQASDAEGISRSIGGALGSHLRQATSQFDDGVLA